MAAFPAGFYTRRMQGGIIGETNCEIIGPWAHWCFHGANLLPVQVWSKLKHIWPVCVSALYIWLIPFCYCNTKWYFVCILSMRLSSFGYLLTKAPLIRQICFDLVHHPDKVQPKKESKAHIEGRNCISVSSDATELWNDVSLFPNEKNFEWVLTDWRCLYHMVLCVAAFALRK